MAHWSIKYSAERKPPLHYIPLKSTRARETWFVYFKNLQARRRSVHLLHTNPHQLLQEREHPYTAQPARW